MPGTSWHSLRDLSDDIDPMVMGALWVRIRCFPWRRRTRAIAANILRDTRADVLHQLTQPRAGGHGSRGICLLVDPQVSVLDRMTAADRPDACSSAGRSLTSADSCTGSASATVRWFRDEAGGWARTELWMTCMVDLSSGNVVDVVDGRDSAAVRNWLEARPRWWRRRVQVVAIDPSAPFRSAVRQWLPKATISVDHFHLVKLGNDAVTAVRRRVSWDRHDRHDRRGRSVDLAWAHRLLLMVTDL